ncbi:hypothetical protein [Pedosphaera parvula]|uniref:Transmembrane protein n=1 Tax=Pedosphaera parvula (strain Ellin514) TaxID=320771 RepID=B9XDG4_PEDPL|nr:hypothetical protein [Pedosphaera parvula]EEF62110.1 hypothetical protein Cflav_PD6385 [Pedosphaera parvula Ellin514]
MRTLSSFIRFASLAMIGFSTLVLVLGTLLFQAASITGTTSNYTVPVSWSSVLTNTLWPPVRLPFLLLLGVVILVGVTTFTYFRMPRLPAVIVLFGLAIFGFLFGGGLGWFFLTREFQHYHFNMDAEKLGEHWFSYESIVLWSFATVALAVLRIFAGTQKKEAIA